MKQIIPILFLSSFLVGQNTVFKQLKESADRKYDVKSYKQAYIDYDNAYKIIKPEIDKIDSLNIQISSTQKEYLMCLVRHASCAHYIGNTDQVKADAEKILTIDSLNSTAKSIKAFLNYKAGDKLIACIEIQKQSVSGTEIAKKMFDDCFCWSEGIFAYRNAKSAFSLAKNEEALLLVNQALAILPDSVNYQIKKGEILCKMEKYKDAITVFSEIIKKDSTNFEALYLRGIAFLKNENANLAFQDLSLCIKINPYNFNAYYQRAEICEEIKEYQSAIYDYQQCIKLNPNNSELHYKIGIIKKNDVEDVLGGCEEFIKAAAMGHEEAKEYAEECNHPKPKKKHK